MPVHDGSSTTIPRIGHLHTTRDHTANMPAELISMICKLLSPASLKKARLACRRWNHLAASVLWRLFKTDFRSTGRRDFNALLTSSEGGFLHSVRILHVRPSYRLSQNNLDMKLLQLLVSLPRNTLQKFIVTRDIDSSTLGLLIKRQPHLHELSVRIHGSPPDSGYIAGNLSDLESLTVFVRFNQKGYDAWFPHAHSLKSLKVQGARLHGPSFTPWLTAQPLPNLSTLNLCGLTFAPSSGRVDRWLNLSKLTCLTIQNCFNLPEFLQDLREAYLGIPKDSLKTLVIEQNNKEALEQRVSGLLDAIGDLDYLHISVPTAKRIDVACLNKHRALRCFVMDPLNAWDNELHILPHPQTHIYGAHMYDEKELSLLAKRCPNLEEFGTSLPMMSFDNWEHTKPFVWSPAGNRIAREALLVKALEAIARFPKLRVLRLVHRPIELPEEDEDNARAEDLSRERQWCHQQLAEQILQLLHKLHSPVQLLAFSPTITNSVGSPDDNGHEWPHYYYLRGESTTVLPRDRKISKVVAVPVRKDDIRDYLGPLRILSEPCA